MCCERRRTPCSRQAQNRTLSVPFTRSSQTMQSFLLSGPRTHNFLPITVKDNRKFPTFKYRWIKHILSDTVRLTTSTLSLLCVFLIPFSFRGVFPHFMVVCPFTLFYVYSSHSIVVHSSNIILHRCIHISSDLIRSDHHGFHETNLALRHFSFPRHHRQNIFLLPSVVDSPKNSDEFI